METTGLVGCSLQGAQLVQSRAVQTLKSPRGISHGPSSHVSSSVLSP